MKANIKIPIKGIICGLLRRKDIKQFIIYAKRKDNLLYITLNIPSGYTDIIECIDKFIKENYED